MGWFSGKKQETLMSTVGVEVIRVIRGSAPDDWSLNTHPTHTESFIITHLKTKLVVKWWRGYPLEVGLEDKKIELNSTDRASIFDAAKTIVPEIREAEIVRRRDDAIQKLQPKLISDPELLLRELARAVLRGDTTAARALLDYLNENPELMSGKSES